MFVYKPQRMLMINEARIDNAVSFDQVEAIPEWMPNVDPELAVTSTSEPEETQPPSQPNVSEPTYLNMYRQPQAFVNKRSPYTPEEIRKYKIGG